MAATSSPGQTPVRTSFSRPPQTTRVVYSIHPAPGPAPSNTQRQRSRSTSGQRRSSSSPRPRPARTSSRDAAIEAIAKFKPTPRDVISHIAPHVFDERGRRRCQKRASRRSWCEANGLIHVQTQKCSSPLRRTTVLSLEEHSIYLEHSGSKASLLTPEPLDGIPPSAVVTVTGASSKVPPLTDTHPLKESHVQQQLPLTVLNAQPVQGADRSVKKSQFRIDSVKLKTLIVKFRFSKFRSIH